MSRTQQTTDRATATTPHGEVEYDVVECSSCGNETTKEDARKFVIGEKMRDRIPEGDFKFYSNSVVEGWACEYCRDDPIEFPDPDLSPPEAIISLTVAFCIGLMIGAALL